MTNLNMKSLEKEDRVKEYIRIREAFLNDLCPINLSQNMWDFSTIEGIRVFAEACFDSGWTQSFNLACEKLQQMGILK